MATLCPALRYKRMKEQEPRLAAEVKRWLDEAGRVDAEEDEKDGKDKRGDELPAWVANKKERLRRIREAKARLEEKAKEKAKRVAAEREAKERAEGKPMTGPKPRALSGVPEDKEQVNFTDPESRILKTRDGYEQGYNRQAAVDASSQVIVAQIVTQGQNDSDELIPIVDQVEDNLGVRLLLGGQPRSPGEAMSPRLSCDGSPEARRDFCDEPRGGSARSSGKGDADAAQARGLPEPLPAEETDRRAAVRTDQRGPGVSGLPYARAAQGRGGVGDGLHRPHPTQAESGGRGCLRGLGPSLRRQAQRAAEVAAPCNGLWKRVPLVSVVRFS